MTGRLCVCLNERMPFLRLACCLLLAACFLPGRAQQGQSAIPPAVLQINREQIKPSRMAEYSRIEGEAAQACAHASTWPYLTIQSMTGPQEAWFISGFDSYAAMEHSAASFARNAALAAELSRLQEAKANLVADSRTVYAHYRDDLSGNSGLVQPGTRYFTITMITVRPGHEREFEDIHRTLKSARQKAGIEDNRVLYQVVSGMPRNIYLIFSAQHSLENAGALLDPAVDDYSNDVDDSTRNRLDDNTRVSVQTSETWVFSVSPAMSNPAGEWIVDDPEFWKSSFPLQRQAAPKKPADNSPK
jgi:hypothetical protein